MGESYQIYRNSPEEYAEEDEDRRMKQSMDDLLNELEEALLSLDRITAQKIFDESGESGSTLDFIEGLIVPVLQRIGEGWQEGRVALSQVYMSGRICEEFTDALLPPEDSARKNTPRMAIAVLEDYHQLGKRIVYSVLKASGFDLLDYGPGIEVDELVRRAIEDRVEILLISTLMLRSALLVKDVTAKLKESGPPVRVVVGGAPFLFDRDLWKEVGADCMGQNASEAVKIVKRIAGGTL